MRINQPRHHHASTNINHPRPTRRRKPIANRSYHSIDNNHVRDLIATRSRINNSSTTQKKCLHASRGYPRISRKH
jgi:hypothetical protein